MAHKPDSRPLPAPGTITMATRNLHALGLVTIVLVLIGCSAPQPRPIQAQHATPRESPPAVIADLPAAAQPSNDAIRPVAEAVPPTESESARNVSDIEESRVFFETGSTTVSNEEKAKLRQHADRLRNNPKIYVTLTGFADDLASRNYRLALSEARLVSVSKLLLSYGVSSRQIRRNRSASVKNSPACTDSNCLQQKRSVVLVYSR